MAIAGKSPDSRLKTIRASQIWLDFAGPAGSFAGQTISFSEVMGGGAVLEKLRGKYILIGATAAALGDRVASPLMIDEYLNTTRLETGAQSPRLASIRPAQLIERGLLILDPLAGVGTTQTRRVNVRVIGASNAALILARKLRRSERTSLGLRLEYLRARGTATGVLAGVTEDFSFVLRFDPQVTYNRRSLSLGVTHDFSGGKKLGAVFRHGTSSTSYGELTRQRDLGSSEFTNTSFGEEHHSRCFSELGVRWRSTMTRRLFYRVESLLRYECGLSGGGVTDSCGNREWPGNRDGDQR